MFLILYLNILQSFSPREEFIKEIIIQNESDDEIIPPYPQQYKNIKEDNDVLLKSPQCFVAITRDNFDKESYLKIKIKYVYKKYLNGFSFCTHYPEVVKKMMSDPSILHLEEEKYYSISGTQTNIPNHMFYISNFENIFFKNYIFGSPIMNYLPFRKIYKFFFGYYKYRYTGKNVLIYLLDTTVNTVSEDISGRVFNLYDSSSCSDHGTNVATLMAGEVNSFAKDAIVNVLNVLDCQGRATLSVILSALELVDFNSLLCLPISGPKSSIFNIVMKNMSKGIIIVTAAGNNSDNGCDFSPGSAEGVINVGSVNKYANISKFSNFNGCIKLFSLGEDLALNSTKEIQGTSYSAALVASSIAIYMESNPKARYSDVWKYLIANSYRRENSFFIQKIPDVKTMFTPDLKTNMIDWYDGINLSIVIWYLGICLLVLFIVLYLLKRRRKEEDLII